MHFADLGLHQGVQKWYALERRLDREEWTRLLWRLDLRVNT
jgi:hypothetical protein